MPVNKDLAANQQEQIWKDERRKVEKVKKYWQRPCVTSKMEQFRGKVADKEQCKLILGPQNGLKGC